MADLSNLGGDLSFQKLEIIQKKLQDPVRLQEFYRLTNNIQAAQGDLASFLNDLVQKDDPQLSQIRQNSFSRLKPTEITTFTEAKEYLIKNNNLQKLMPKLKKEYQSQKAKELRWFTAIEDKANYYFKKVHNSDKILTENEALIIISQMNLDINNLKTELYYDQISFTKHLEKSLKSLKIPIFSYNGDKEIDPKEKLKLLNFLSGICEK